MAGWLAWLAVLVGEGVSDEREGSKDEKHANDGPEGFDKLGDGSTGEGADHEFESQDGWHG
jgi:hypothetical protein